jgi:hypothetical protein
LGILWRPPFRVELSGRVRSGGNEFEIAVTNLWPNRLIGDAKLPPERRVTKTNVTKFRQGRPALLESGLLGPVRIVVGEEVRRPGSL